MKKNDCTLTKLDTGEIALYDLGNIRLHAYQTNDPIDDEVFIVEKDGRGFVIEYPCFRDNIAELEQYLDDAGIAVEGILAAYHMAGASFLAGTPVYATAEADAYGHAGGGKALIDNFAGVFGDVFDSSIAEVTNVIEGDRLELAGIEMNIVRTPDAFDIEIPAINSVYTHMLGHDCHSIVAGEAHADAVIAQLKAYQDAGIDLVLTSHYTPEDLKDVATKIAYLEKLKELASQSNDANDFKQKMQERYPEYAGENYLDMTVGFFFGE